MQATVFFKSYYAYATLISTF